MNQIRILSRNEKIVISAGFLLIIILSSILTFSLSVWILQTVLGLVTLYFCFKTDYKTAKLWLCILGISLLFIFLVFLANQLYYGEPYYNDGSDDLAFEKWGYDVYNHGIYNPSKVMKLKILGQYHNSPFYPVYIARLIQFAELFDGYTTFLPRIANAYFLLWICMIIKYLLDKYAKLSKKTIHYSLCFFAFMPNIQYINAHVFRDTFNLLQVLLIILLFDFLFSKKHYSLKMISIVTLTLLIYLTYYTRVNSLLFAGVILLLRFSVRYRVKKRYIIIGIVFLLLTSNFLEIFRVGYFIKTYSTYVSNIAGDGLSSFIFKRPLLPIGIFLRALYALISPFPNFFGLFKDNSSLLFDFIQLLIYLGVLVQIICIPFIIKRLLKFDWLALAFLGWFLAVIGTTFTFRHFLFYYPFMGGLVIDGFMNTKTKTRKITISISIFVMLSLGVIYALLKIL